MKRYIKYIFLSLITCFLASSCIEEIAAPQPETGSELATLVPRVKSFTNQYVTKATDPYTQNEKKIEKLTVLIFSGAADEQENHRLIYTQQTNGSSLMLNKSELNTIASSSELTSATVVMFANVSLADIMKENSDGTYTAIGNSLTLEELNDCSIHMGDSPVVLSSELESFGGFPMKGVATANLTIGSTAPIVVNLQILYAKVNFEINVAAGTENQALTQPSFTLQKFFVHNVAKRTSVELADGAATASTDHVTTGKEEICSNNTFTFYIPESRYNPKANENGKIDLAGIYPTGWTTSVATEDVKGYTDAMAAQLNGVKYFYDDLVQQYKPKLAEGTAGTPSNTEEGLATYVIVKGTYVDYRNTTWDVNYKIYLGKDNAQNFHVDRNSEYTNILTIKGIRNNDSYGDGNVWIDHRVDVTDGGLITITRETLIDAHFEVRPLRVSLPSNINRVLLYLPKYENGAQIQETEKGTGENWIAVENNNGRLQDVTLYSENGKRRYFTSSLIKELHLDNNDETYGIQTNNNINDNDRKGQRYIQLFDGDCAWIYIDENTTEEERSAQIDLVFYNASGNPVSVENVILKQTGLYKSGDYFIEKFEEYLHTYDSQDLYTDPSKDYTQQGYQWGLSNVRLSNSRNVVAAFPTPSSDYYYDYFHALDKANLNTLINTEYLVVENNSNKSDLSQHIGLHFTNIAGISDKMPIIDMSSRPSSAIQYCLSKNKFKVDENDTEQHTMDIHWYLPDVYEMSQILTHGKDDFTDFNNYYYWTSQPSWTKELADAYLDEDKSNARAVSIADLNKTESYQGSNKSRQDIHRIRCAYSPTPIPDVSFAGDRAPEGIGAMHFYMRAWKDWPTKQPGYFGDKTYDQGTHWLLETDDDVPGSSGEFTLPDTYVFPKTAADADSYTGDYVDGYGFRNHPPTVAENYTEEVGALEYLSYVALNKWPGLSIKQVVSKRTPAGRTYYTKGDDKKEVKTETSSSVTTYADDITAETSLKPLDHLLGHSDLSISFTKGASSTHAPKYEYYKVNSTATTTTTRTWEIPVYNLTPKVETATYTERTPAGTVQLTDAQKKLMKAAWNPQEVTNPDGYIYNDDASAEAAGLALTLPDGSYDRDVNTESEYVATYSYQTTLWGSRSEYYAQKYRYVVTYKIDGSSVPYYLYQNGTGKWIENGVSGDPVPNTNAPEVDKLTMYGGNSFTIKANNGKKISSVKVHFSGSNVIYAPTAGTTKFYLRFTKDGFVGNSNDLPEGMSYTVDGDSGEMTWTGVPEAEVTFKLVVYNEKFDWYNSFGDPSSFQYLGSATSNGIAGIRDYNSYEESIIIDQIDVRYK